MLGGEKINLKFHSVSTVKAPGGLFNFGPSRGGLNREGGLLERGAYSQNQVTRDIFGSFSVLLSHILRNQLKFYGSNT